MRRWSVAWFPVVFCLAAPFVQAEYKTYVPDFAHSQINFVGEAFLISAHGHFDKWEAEFQIDREKLENSKISITIDASSIYTRVQRRDDHLRSADFLDVQKYPQIKFVSASITRQDDKNYILTGDLTLKAVTKQISVPITVVFLRENDARFKGDFKINRWDYGINYDGKMNPIEDMISIQVDMHLQDKASIKPPPPRPANP